MSGVPARVALLRLQEPVRRLLRGWTLGHSDGLLVEPKMRSVRIPM